MKNIDLVVNNINRKGSFHVLYKRLSGNRYLFSVFAKKKGGVGAHTAFILKYDDGDSYRYIANTLKWNINQAYLQH